MSVLARALASVTFLAISPPTNQNATATCSSTTHSLTTTPCSSGWMIRLDRRDPDARVLQLGDELGSGAHVGDQLMDPVDGTDLRERDTSELRGVRDHDHPTGTFDQGEVRVRLDLVMGGQTAGQRDPVDAQE